MYYDCAAAFPAVRAASVLRVNQSFGAHPSNFARLETETVEI